MVWTPAQLGAFLDAVDGDRLYALWHLVAHRGLRRGEVCAVEWQDVDLDAGTLVVCRQLVQLGWDVIESARSPRRVGARSRSTRAPWTRCAPTGALRSPTGSRGALRGRRRGRCSFGRTAACCTRRR